LRISIITTLGIVILSSIFLMDESFGGLNDVGGESNAPILKDPSLQIELILTGLDFPTQLTFIDDETILVSQKNNGKVVVIKNFVIQKNHALDLNVEASVERGLLGLSSTNFQGEDYVFVFYTESGSESDTHVFGNEKEGNENNGNKLVRYKWNGKSLIDPVLILQPNTFAREHHSGGVIEIFDETIYLIVGDNQIKSTLTNARPAPEMDHGVILRVDFNGKPIPSNPFTDPSLSKYFAHGIRNSFGMDIDPLTNNVWDTENGPANFDEINLVSPGFNSGWIRIIGPLEESFFPYTLDDLSSFEGSKYSDPEFSWNKTIGITAIEFLESKQLGDDYQFDAFVGDVHGRLYHFELNDNRDKFIFSDPLLQDLVAHTEQEAESIILGKNLGLITDIKTGPDGYLYVLSLVSASDWFDNWARPLKTPEVVEQGQLTGVLFRISSNQPSPELIQEEEKQTQEEVQDTSKEGGGCLIATATFGTELSTEVQMLRELRDNTVLTTTSGTAFMTGFNQFYYSFSPMIADMERENQLFKEFVRITITPLLYSLSFLNNLDINSETEMLVGGIGIISLNVGLYFAIPILAGIKLKRILLN